MDIGVHVFFNYGFLRVYGPVVGLLGHMAVWELPWWLSGKELPTNTGDTGFILGLGRYPEEENGKPLQYFCLGNPMDRGAWWATVHVVTKSQTCLTTTMVVLFLYFKGISILFSIMTIYIPTNDEKSFPFFYIFSCIYCLQIFLMMAILTCVR